MTEKEKGEFRSYFAMLGIFLLMFLFKSDRTGAWDWDRFWVGVYEESLGLLFPYCFVNLLHIKSERARCLFFLVMFLVMDATLDISLDLPKNPWVYVLMGLGIAFWCVSLFSLRRIQINKGKPTYTKPKRIRDLSILVGAGVVVMGIFAYMYIVRYILI